MFGHITIYKSQSPLQMEIFRLKKNFSRTTTNGSFGLQRCFPVFVTSQILNSAYGNLNGWRVGRMLGEHCTFQNRNPVHVFLYHCISDGKRLGYVRNPRSLSVGHYELCRDDIGDLPGSPEHL